MREPRDPCGYDAVILAGGAARRLGGIDKPGLRVGASTLLEHVAAALGAPGSAARRVIVVGPQRSSPAAVYVREDPPGSGPVAAVRAGLAEVTAPWVALLAADLPFLRSEDITGLLQAARGRTGAVRVDTEGIAQWLFGVWQGAALRSALAGYSGSSMRGLLTQLDPVRLEPGEGDDMATFDCDTPADVAHARKTR